MPNIILIKIAYKSEIFPGFMTESHNYMKLKSHILLVFKTMKTKMFKYLHWEANKYFETIRIHPNSI